MKLERAVAMAFLSEDQGDLMIQNLWEEVRDINGVALGDIFYGVGP
jgi:hypothetical protein